MRSMRRRAVACALALAPCLVFAPGAAEAKKVTETAPPVLLPDAINAGGSSPTVYGEATQSFRLKGAKVKDKQILDVNLTLNLNAPPDALFSLTNVSLIGPKGNEAVLPYVPFGTSWVELEFDDQSSLFACSSGALVSSHCNYTQDGVLTGSLHATINPNFKGGNAKGEWRVLFQDSFDDDDPPIAIGTSTLEVKTGRKFERESG